MGFLGTECKVAFEKVCFDYSACFWRLLGGFEGDRPLFCFLDGTLVSESDKTLRFLYEFQRGCFASG